jgi:hypothetical protein
MKQMAFVCDRCGVKATGRYEHHLSHMPTGWSDMRFGADDYDLCAACTEDVRLALANMKLEHR